MRIVFATGNQNKMREIHEIMDDLGMEIVSMKEAGISADIVEDGTSFEENAVIKASAIARQCEDIVLADDSGLEVDALNKEPGIYSARYMGEDTSYRIKNQNIIDRLEGVPDEKRSARFVCAVAAVFPDGSHAVVRETIEGRIGYKESGENGFGYDPYFVPEGMTRTFAELPAEVKNGISHRARALDALKKLLTEEK